MTVCGSAVAGALTLVLLQSQTPVFRGNTSLVVVDVQVTNRSGDVIGDLGIADFSLKVDGKSRAITGVVRQEIDVSRPAAVIRPNDNPMGTLSMGTGPKLEAQSFVLIVADPALMRPEASRPLFDQAAEFVAGLPAAHAVGLMILPSRRSQYPFGTPRATIAAALRQQLGSMGESSTPLRSDGFLPIPRREQQARDGDRFGIAAAIDELEAGAGRRTMIFLSDRFEAIIDLAERAADANITVHTITTKPSAMIDVSRRTNTTAKDAGSGFLSLLSDHTGGLFLVRASNGSIVLPRIAALLSERYLLAFAISDADRAGKSHSIDVKVNRNGADVRARKSFVR